MALKDSYCDNRFDAFLFSFPYRKQLILQGLINYSLQPIGKIHSHPQVIQNNIKSIML